MIRFGIIGSGWRSEFYWRIAALLPELFTVTGIVIRDPAKKEAFRTKCAVSICDSIAELRQTSPDFVVSCVRKDGICDMITALCRDGIAVLSETPLGADIEQIERFEKQLCPAWRVQVAEQFHFQPQNQAIKAVIDSGILGNVHQVQLSCCHDYHAISLIRFFLDLGYDIPRITAVTLPDDITAYNGRNGVMQETKEITSRQTVAILDFGGKSALYDFSEAQYFSDIRRSRIVIRGTKGEIVNNACTYLEGTVPLHFTIERNMRGIGENLDGLYLDSIVGNGRILYENPFGKARLSDEEIAMATCLINMREYLQHGREFYSVADAAADARIAYQQQKGPGV